MGTSYAVQGGSRILNASRVDQSGSDNADVINWVLADNFILAVNINSGGKETVSAQYKLRWRVFGGTFADVAATGAIKFGTTDLTNSGDIVVGGRKCSSVGSDTWQTGKEVEGTALSTAIDLVDEYETEIHFSLSCADAAAGALYEFELYDGTAGASKGTCGATLTTAEAAPDALTSKDIVTPVPTVAKPSISQVHSLTDKDIETPVPTVTKSVLGQVHVLVNKDIVTPVPTVTKSVLAEAASEDVLTSKDIVTPVPTVTKSVIGQKHTLTDKDITTPVPTVAKSAIGQVHVLTNKDVITPVPTVSKSVIGQVHVLTDKDIITPVPTVTKPILGIAEAGVDNLVSKDIITPVPTVTKSLIGQVHVLTDKDITTPALTVGKPTLGIGSPIIPVIRHGGQRPYFDLAQIRILREDEELLILESK